MHKTSKFESSGRLRNAEKPYLITLDERHASDLKSINLFTNDFYKDNNDNSTTDPARGFNLQVDERITDCESNAVAIVDKSATSSCPK